MDGLDMLDDTQWIGVQEISHEMLWIAFVQIPESFCASVDRSDIVQQSEDWD
jgi:hypothetical protein